MTTTREYDYIIVGAGSAGCTLAHRLSEDRDTAVLVLEAGGWDRSPLLAIPLAWGKVFEKRMHDWMYFSEPQSTLNGRRIECARGKVIGGSSSINAMGYVRGHRGDYDRWAAHGLEQWSYARILPYFRRQESWEGGGDFYRGSDGPLTTRFATYADPVVEAYLEAGVEAGYAATPDYNGEQQEGFGRLQSTIRNGKRCSTAVAYLRPARARANLTVATDALVLRVVFEGNRAVGVEYERTGEVTLVRARREVLLAGGVINSPQLLMVSGIGDPDELKANSIAVKVPLKGVGKNLQDHVSVAVEYQRNGPGPLQRALRVDRLAVAMGQAYFLGTGFATDLPCGWTAFLKSDPSVSLPDIQFIFRAAPLGAKPYVGPGFADGFACRAVVLRPESRGAITLASNDPRAPVRIRSNFFAADADWKAMRQGVRMARGVGRQRALAPFIGAELGPGPGQDSDAAIDDYIRATAATPHHPLGTCKMGVDSDSMAVVDPELRVRGVEGLRVVDASVMPDLVGGNINGPVIMIAEKAADMIRGRPPLAPAGV